MQGVEQLYRKGDKAYLIRNSIIKIALKKISPNIWATHGGCANAGETSLNACIREAYEEIRILIKAKNVRPLVRYRLKIL